MMAIIEKTCQTKLTQWGVKIGSNNRMVVISLNTEFELCSSSNNRFGDNELEFRISILYLFKWLIYKHLRIQDVTIDNTT